MKTTTDTLQRGKLVPNWIVKDQGDEKHSIWDFRQKSHVVLLYIPESQPDTVKHWLSAIEADRKQWDWLNVKILIVKEAPKDLAPGAYAIDRYGMLLNHYPATTWNFADIEKEYLYYEAYHC